MVFPKSILLTLFFLATLFNDFELGVHLFNNQKWDAAKMKFQNHLKKYPNDLKTIEYLGDIAGHQKNWDVAIDYYGRLKASVPNNADYHYKYGGVLGMKAKITSKWKALGMIGEVEDAFLKAAQLDEGHIDCRWALVQLYMELPGIVGGSERKARLYAQELMNLSKIDGLLAFGLIEVYQKRYKKAEEYYVKAHLTGNSKTTFQKLYQLYQQHLKEPEKAAQLKAAFEK
ncbi:tetratricopeptide repeat protein [Imtechella halotolerans]|uniref:Tetratricopeptide repeat protein n=1 Tax=Imtechella halotolerans K1 TaxID=946077 RepID=I0WDZ4_9FLAO|nr:hypothetical protein [Imtechella halotolerans]EID74610.1 hypothetical protein W5A_08767 [Imtechella halotolerans K1]WMQ62458.1 hypothetical protein PT603_08935 [Imtechella halotolerans]